MTPVELARRLLDGLEPFSVARTGDAAPRVLIGGSTGYRYWYCGGQAPLADGHAPDCPWLRRDEIIAALEASDQSDRSAP